MNRSTLSAFAGAAIIAMAVGAGINLSAAGQAQTPDDADVRKRIAALEAGQQAILKELREIKILLQARPPMPLPTPAPSPGGPLAQAAPNNGVAPSPSAGLPNFDLDIAGSPSKGRAEAKLVLVEFSDFECPFCGRYSRETFDVISKEFVDTGKLRYVFRHFPIEKLHPHAMRASEGAECARAQGKFWEYHNSLFASQQALNDPDLTRYAQALNLDMPAFQQCMAAQAVAPTKVRQDLSEGARAGITGTPTFFIGTVTKEGKLKVLRRMVGAHPIASFRTTLETVLGEVGK